MTKEIQTKLRPFTFDDAQACVDIFNACSRHLYGYDDTNLDENMNDWTSPGFNAEESIRVVEDSEGHLIGYIDVWDTTNPHATKYIWGVLHPDAWDDDLYHDMLTWAENRARERIKLAPEGCRVVINQGASSKDVRRKKAMESSGFKLVRHFYRMEIELAQAPAEPVIPEGLTIVPIDLEHELDQAITTMDEAFRDHWGYIPHPIEEMLEQWQHFIENDKDFDPSLWFLAKDGDQIAGNCRCSPKIVEDPQMGWVSQLAVRKPWRRRGVGMALLLTAFNEFYQRGQKRVGLGVDASSLTNATRLYEKAGMHVAKQYDTYEKEIRPGKDLATR